MDETKRIKDPKERVEKGPIEKVGAGGQVGEGQSGVPLHKPQGERDRELGPRERVGAGGVVGEGQAGRVS